MRSLIRVVAERTCPKVRFLSLRFIYILLLQYIYQIDTCSQRRQDANFKGNMKFMFLIVIFSSCLWIGAECHGAVGKYIYIFTIYNI